MSPNPKTASLGDSHRGATRNPVVHRGPSCPYPCQTRPEVEPTPSQSGRRLALRPRIAEIATEPTPIEALIEDLRSALSP